MIDVVVATGEAGRAAATTGSGILCFLRGGRSWASLERSSVKSEALRLQAEGVVEVLKGPSLAADDETRLRG
jgi:hypothetical protein